MAGTRRTLPAPESIRGTAELVQAYGEQDNAKDQDDKAEHGGECGANVEMWLVLGGVSQEAMMVVW